MTALATYQRLALSECAALSIRKLASRRLLAFEQGCDEQAQGRRDTLALMKRDEPGRRDALVGTVNATSDSQGASERIHVADSHDARPGSQRAAQREYSERTFRRDVRSGRSPASKCEPCVTYSVPLWALALADEQRGRLLTSAPRVFALPSDERDERTRTMRQRRGDEAALALARKRAAATGRDERTFLA